MAEDSKRMLARNEVCRDGVVDSTADPLPCDAGEHQRRRRRHRRDDTVDAAGVAAGAGGGGVGSAAAAEAEPSETARAIVAWYVTQDSATHENVITLQHWLRRLRDAERRAERARYAAAVGALVEKYGGG